MATGQYLLPADAAVPAPAGENELQALVRAAAEARRPISAEGNGTKLHHGPAGAAAARRVSLRRLDRITGYEPGDMVVSVQAGVKLADLQRRLAEHGQWLPIDPPYADATMGGILATASAGPRRLGYGPPKDALLGMRVVGAGGVITKSGARVVKNVSGFDLHKLQVGAFGSLGVILEAHFKTSPRPVIRGALLLACDRASQALELLLHVRGLPLRPVALEALDPGAAQELREVKELGALLPGTSEAALAIIGIEGSRAAFDRHLKDLADVRRGVMAEALLEGADGERLWAGLRDAPGRHTEQITVRVGARPHDLSGLLGSFGIADEGAVGIQCHVGNGIARITFHPGVDALDLAPRLQQWHAQAAALQGYVVAESAPLDLENRETLPWGAAATPIGQHIKRAWDPHELLNPGRSVL
jgi:glycolate oxidase FAD binding subunit